MYLSLVVLAIAATMCKPTDDKPDPDPNKKKDSIVTKKEAIWENQDSLDSLFTAAMLTARNPTPARVSNNLTPIVGNNTLIDTMINAERYIKMVSWKSNPSYFPDSGVYNTQSYDIWVTAAPFIQDSCKHYFKTLKNPELRLRQLLGLQPTTPETFFLEVWVKPSDLFRPCPDNETDDTTCGLELPATVKSDYRKWFNDLRSVQYTDCTDTLYHEYGYPWTQLGYTYDWSEDNPSHQGLSEFVITRMTDIYISGKYQTANYCK